jgi:hypothetical protein
VPFGDADVEDESLTVEPTGPRPAASNAQI